MAFHLPTTANHGGDDELSPTSPPAAGEGGGGILDGGVNAHGVPTLNVDMSLRPHRPGSAASHGGVAEDFGAGGCGGGMMVAMSTAAASSAAVTARPATTGFGRFGLGGGGVGTIVDTTSRPATTGSFVGLGFGGGGNGGGVGGSMMTTMTTGGIGGSFDADSGKSTSGGQKMRMMERTQVQTDDAGAQFIAATTSFPHGDDEDDDEAPATTITTAATVSGVVAIPGPPDVEAALQDVAALTRDLEHTLEDVRMMTVENAILMDSLALVGADV